MGGINITTILLIGVFLLISWMTRIIIYRDITNRHKNQHEKGDE